MPLDLQKHTYSPEELVKHIHEHTMLEILTTQRLTAKFVAKFVLNPLYQISKEDQQISIQDVYFYQPHITKMELLLACCLRDDDDLKDDLNFEKTASEK